MLSAHQILIPFTEISDIYALAEVADSLGKMLNSTSLHLIYLPRMSVLNSAKAAITDLDDLSDAHPAGLTQEIERRLSETKHFLKIRGIEVSIEVIPTEYPSESILKATMRLRPEMVVMTTSAKGKERLSEEQQTLKLLLRKGGVNVMMVPLRNAEQVLFSSPERILVPVDFSGYARAALTVAKELAHELPHSRLMVLNVATQSAGYLAPQVHNWEYQFARDRIRMSLFQRLEGFIHDTHGPDAQYDLDILFGDPVHQILTTATRSRTDLIVMSSHGLSGIERLMMGSVTEGVMRQASVPLLVVKASDVPTGMINAPLLAASA
ncbi:MAG: universal stress protein [Bacteroidetes Order II. Incertae sedis bacterium]|nr:universal stress protein [Bacteroidetes Order II. bacterium]